MESNVQDMYNTSRVFDLQNELAQLGNPEAATILQRFFKTGPGEYAEGDRFRGIKVPVLRAVVKKYSDLELSELEQLLHSEFHEDRLVALLIMVRQFERGDEKLGALIYKLYLKNTSLINNWDLVDSSAPQIVGGYLWERDRKPLYRLARSRGLWERRISILATAFFIRRGDFDDTLAIAEVLLGDRHDLIHKAVGWMLREIGKRSFSTEQEFLERHAAIMPRTMLRYAIEKFPEPERRRYMLAGKAEIGSGIGE
jgi:3-methyladenine DNA glycosylase AlkD